MSNFHLSIQKSRLITPQNVTKIIMNDSRNFNPIPYGGGNIAPLAKNRPLSVKKIRIFKNEPSENALPTPRNPT